MSLPFTKLHGAGNDFVLLDGRGELPPELGALARALGDRHTGVGFDQLLVVRDGSTHRYCMEIWNADGSRAEMCGNGIRCFAKWLFDRREITTGPITIETLGGPRWVDVDGYRDDGFKVAVGMGRPSFDPAALPMSPGPDSSSSARLVANGCAVDVVGVSVGNPHAVAFVDDVNEFPLESVGPTIERHPLFPQRVNFEIAQVTGPDALRVRVWERGAGLTLACGTGAAATAAVAIAEEKVVSGQVELDMPGGRLWVTWPGKGSEAVLHGPAATVFSGVWPGG